MNYFQVELLPDDILLHEVLPNLPLEKLNMLCRTSKKFRNLCNNDELWRSRVEKEYPGYPKPPIFSYNEFYKFLLKSKRIPVYLAGNDKGYLRISNDYLDYPLYQASISLYRIWETPVEIFSIIYTDENFIPIAISEYPSLKFKFKSTFLNNGVDDISYAFTVIGKYDLEGVNQIDLNNITSIIYAGFLFTYFFPPARVPWHKPIYGFIRNNELLIMIVKQRDINNSNDVHVYFCNSKGYIYLVPVIKILEITLPDNIIIPPINEIIDYLIDKYKTDKFINLPQDELILTYQLSRSRLEDICNLIKDKLIELKHFFPTSLRLENL